MSDFRRKILMEENDDKTFTITAYMIEDEKPMVVVVEGDFEGFITSIEGAFEVAVQASEKMTIIPDNMDAL